MKGVEYLPSVRRLLRRIDALRRTSCTSSGSRGPSSTSAGCAGSLAAIPSFFTAHNAMPRRERAYGAWREALDAGGSRRRALDTGGRAPDRVRRSTARRSSACPSRLRLAGAPSGRAAVGERRCSSSGSSGTTRPRRARPRAAGDQATCPDVRLVVAGDPLEPIAPVQELASSLSVADAIEWRLGFVPDSEVPPLVARAAVVVLPTGRSSPRECWRSPSDTGAPPSSPHLLAVGDAVREFGAGRAVPAEDPAALAGACVELRPIRPLRARRTRKRSQPAPRSPGRKPLGRTRRCTATSIGATAGAAS